MIFICKFVPINSVAPSQEGVYPCLNKIFNIGYHPVPRSRWADDGLYLGCLQKFTKFFNKSIVKHNLINYIYNIETTTLNNGEITMGERSSIFVRIRSKKRSSDKNYQMETFFGLYYQWCYGERMISRLRSAIDFVDREISGWHGEYVVSKETTDKFKRYLAVNFDMQDILEPVDIIQAWVNDVMRGYSKEKADIFAQDENHGYIYIDITLDDPDKKFGENNAKIKYAFVDNEYKGNDGKVPPIRSVENFADHDMGNDERKWYDPSPYWDERGMTTHKEHFLNEIVPTAKKNIEEINKSATLMTEDDRKDFVKFGRAFTRKILKKAEKEKAEIKAKREALTAEIFEKFHSYEKGYKDLLELVDKAYPKPAKE